MTAFTATFIEAAVPLVKEFSDTGHIPYPLVKRLTSHEVFIPNIEAFHQNIVERAEQLQALFTGRFTSPLVNESRAGKADLNHGLSWICIDIDGLQTESAINTREVQSCAEHALSLLPDWFQNVSYVAQASSKLGMSPNKISIHLFFVLDAVMTSDELKRGLTNLNFSQPAFNAKIELSKSGFSLKYKLDPALAENSRIVYIGHPIFRNLENPIDNERRIVLVRKDHCELPTAKFDLTVPQTKITRRINDARAMGGMPAAKARFVRVSRQDGEAGTTSVLSNPEPGHLTFAHEARGYRYYNIGDGDSAAYFHPNGRPEVVYNFKGEPPFLWEQFDPETYAAYVDEHFADIIVATPRRIFPIQNSRDNRIGVVEHDLTTNTATVVYSSRDLLENRLASEGVAAPEFLPVYTVDYNPHSQHAIDRSTKPYPLVNEYRHSDLLSTVASAPAGLPAGYGYGYGCASLLRDICPTTYTILNHALGCGEEELNHFVNWLAWICHHRDKSGTAWILQGVEGTGKGLLYSHVLSPLLGESNCVLQQNTAFSDKFNSWRANKLLVVIDEFRIRSIKDTSYRDALWNAITETQTALRGMQKDWQQQRLYENYIMYTNRPDMLPMSQNDRRINVAPRQEVPLRIAHPEVMARINDGSWANEIPDFAAFLTFWTIDDTLARTPLSNSAKSAARKASLTSFEELCLALHSGDITPFLDVFQINMSDGNNSILTVQDAKQIVSGWLANVRMPYTKCSTRDLRTVYEALGCRFDSPMGFGKGIARHNIIPKMMRVGGELVKGLELTFSPELITDEINDHIQSIQQQTAARVH